MKKVIFSLLIVLMVLVFKNTVVVKATSHDPDLMLLSFADVETALEFANGNDEVFVETLSQIGYDNYNNGSSTSVGTRLEIFGVNLTTTEIYLMINNPHVVAGWWLSADKAINKTDELYIDDTDGSKGNSFQHAYWNVLMTKYIGPTYAELFASVHEDYSDNPWMHKTMDLFNNNCGRQLAISINNLQSTSDDNLAMLTRNLVINGNLKYILEDYVYIYKYIYYDDRIENEYSISDFIAYTNSTQPINLPDPIIDDRRTNDDPIIMPMFSVYSEEEENSVKGK